MTKGFPSKHMMLIIMNNQKIRRQSQIVKLLSHCRNPSQSITACIASSKIKGGLFFGCGVPV